jgi:hypothetical protein
VVAAAPFGSAEFRPLCLRVRKAILSACPRTVVESLKSGKRIGAEANETMSEIPNESGHAGPQSIAPTFQLSRRGLIFSLLAVVIAGLCVYATFPESVGGPELPVDVALDRRPVETVGGLGAVLTEVVVVKNLTDHEIPRFGLEVNGQYLLFRDSPLASHEELVLPLRVFTDKRSSQRYDPKKYPPSEVVVTGQLPSGARGLSQFHFDT